MPSNRQNLETGEGAETITQNTSNPKGTLLAKINDTIAREAEVTLDPTNKDKKNNLLYQSIRHIVLLSLKATLEQENMDDGLLPHLLHVAYKNNNTLFGDDAQPITLDNPDQFQLHKKTHITWGLGAGAIATATTCTLMLASHIDDLSKLAFSHHHFGHAETTAVIAVVAFLLITAMVYAIHKQAYQPTMKESPKLDARNRNGVATLRTYGELLKDDRIQWHQIDTSKKRPDPAQDIAEENQKILISQSETYVFSELNKLNKEGQKSAKHWTRGGPYRGRNNFTKHERKYNAQIPKM